MLTFRRRKRRVRYHLFDGNGHLDAPSLEGIETGLEDGHYVGYKGAQVNAAGQSVPFEGDGRYAIARERVFYRQILTS